jgi:hypothetical protein
MRNLAICLAFISIASLAAAAGSASPTPPVVVEPYTPVEITKPDHVIGAGTPESVTEDALQKALHSGGSIIFNSGGRPVTLKLSKPLLLPGKAKPAILDGMGLVTLDGEGKTALIRKEWKTELTVQRLHFQHARTDKEGAAIWNMQWDGRTTVIDCQFEDCKTTAIGPDIGGGAIRVTGQKHLIVSGCSFVDCEGSNGGAICTIGCQMTIVNCTFQKCHAFGFGGGADRGPTGQGGIGGAVYIDGVSQNADKKQLYVGNCLFQDNRAGDHAGAIFGYTVPKQASVSIYYNTIFENNSVDEPKEKGVGLAGAVYSQFCDLHVINCTFAHNKCHGIAGALFMSTLEGEHIANCEFYGNSPEFKSHTAAENISMSKRDTPPAVITLGRMPGVPQQEVPNQSTKTVETEKKTPVAPASAAAPATPKIDEKTLAGYDTKLRSRLHTALDAGKKVTAFVHLVGSGAAQEYRIASCDDKAIQVSVDGNEMPMKWEWVSVKDRAAIAEGLMRADSDDVLSIILTAIYCAADGQSAKAEDLFAKAGIKDAGAVTDARRSIASSSP